MQLGLSQPDLQGANRCPSTQPLAPPPHEVSLRHQRRLAHTCLHLRAPALDCSRPLAMAFRSRFPQLATSLHLSNVWGIRSQLISRPCLINPVVLGTRASYRKRASPQPCHQEFIDSKTSSKSRPTTNRRQTDPKDIMHVKNTSTQLPLNEQTESDPSRTQDQHPIDEPYEVSCLA